MRGYLGEFIQDISTTEYTEYTKLDWALLWIEMYGGHEGAHHKTWVLDQVAQILNGTRVVLKLAKWEDGTEEERFSLAEPVETYHKWVERLKKGEDGPDTYGYDIGIAP